MLRCVNTPSTAAVKALKQRNPVADPAEIERFALLARRIAPSVMARYAAEGRNQQQQAAHALEWLKDFEVVLHRSGRNLVPENMVEGTQASIDFLQQRFPGIKFAHEFDYQLTSNKKLVVHHDESLNIDHIKINSKEHRNPFLIFPNLYIKYMELVFIKKHFLLGHTKSGSQTNVLFDNQIVLPLTSPPEVSDFKTMHPETPAYVYSAHATFRKSHGEMIRNRSDILSQYVFQLAVTSFWMNASSAALNWAKFS